MSRWPTGKNGSLESSGEPTDSECLLLPAFSSTGPGALCGQILLPEIPSGLRPPRRSRSTNDRCGYECRKRIADEMGAGNRLSSSARPSGISRRRRRRIRRRRDGISWIPRAKLIPKFVSCAAISASSRMSGEREEVCLLLPLDLSPAICEAATNVGRRDKGRSNAGQLMMAIDAEFTGRVVKGVMVFS